MRWNRTWQPEIEGVPVPVFIPLPVNNTTTASPMDTTGTISPEIDVLVEDALNASATKALRAEPQSTITENGPYHGPFEGTTTTLPDCSEEPTSTTSTVAEPLTDVFTPSDVEEDVFIPSDIEDFTLSASRPSRSCESPWQARSTVSVERDRVCQPL